MGTLVAGDVEPIDVDLNLHSQVIAMRTLSLALLVWMTVACSSNDDSVAPPPMDNGQAGANGSGGDGGGGGSDGTETQDAAPDVEIVACGATSCNAGEYCCDGTCGACIAVGMNCPPDPCPSDGATSTTDSSTSDGSTSDGWTSDGSTSDGASPVTDATAE
jgi:hypothetical protein